MSKRKAGVGWRRREPNLLSAATSHSTFGPALTERWPEDADTADRIRSVMMIALEGRNVKGTVAALRKNPGFAAMHTTNGLWDLIAEIKVPSMAEFNRLLTGIRVMEGISKPETRLCLGPT